MILGRTLLRVGKNAVSLLLGRGLVLLLGLWLNGQIVRNLGVAGLGRYLLAMTIEGISLAIANLGLNTLATREFSRSTPSETEMLLGDITALKLATSVLVALFLNTIAAPLLFPGQRRVLIAIASLALLPEAINGALDALIRGRQRMELSSGIDVATRLFGTFGGLHLLQRGGDVRHVLTFYVLGRLLGTLVLILSLVVWRIRPQWKGCRQRAMPTLRQALPFAGTDLVAILYRRIDLLLLAYWQGDAATGIYGAAYRLFEALGLLPASLLDAIFPLLSRAGSDPRRRTELVQLSRTASIALLIPTVLVGSICVGLAPQMVTLLYGRTQDTSEVTRLFRLLVIALPTTGLYLLGGHLLFAIGQQRRVFWNMSVVACGNAVLNLALIPWYGYWGCVVAALTSSTGLAILLGSGSRRHLKQDTSPPEQFS